MRAVCQVALWADQFASDSSALSALDLLRSALTALPDESMLKGDLPRMSQYSMPANGLSCRQWEPGALGMLLNALQPGSTRGWAASAYTLPEAPSIWSVCEQVRLHPIVAGTCRSGRGLRWTRWQPGCQRTPRGWSLGWLPGRPASALSPCLPPTRPPATARPCPASSSPSCACCATPSASQ